MNRTRPREILRPLVTLASSAPRLPNALKAGLTVLLCLAIPDLLGRFDLGLLTVTGTFAVLYAPAAPLRRRAATRGAARVVLPGPVRGYRLLAGR